ncbi:hypothetical protein C2857_007806 [Epichloe festucae Fl1]|uniref:F-box domain-containing protein n=1 Tax=Epichloe festucae (strain Fl1) TaxID=877507 RepID=A0A7S9PTB1_EPIFF|nr:hypothetical protein C2857_007806 [Epichloe festucae Fl1]
MASSSQGLNSELESFRQQWLSEVRTKRSERPRPSSAAHSHSSPTAPVSPKRSKARPPSPTKTRKVASAVDEEDGNEHSQPRVFEGSPEPSGNTIDGSVGPPLGKELVSALDHYEEAMAKEAEGNMGDSLKLYRRAYRLDNRVDRRYREKHFPQAHTSQPSPLPQSTAQTQTPDPSATTSPRPPVILLPIEHLIASFSRLRIEPAAPEVEGSPPGPSPISSLPRELLVHIMRDVAVHDVGDFARLSLVCKPLAYLVSTEQPIWRDVSLGTKFGFTGMHYHWPDAEPPQEGQPQDGTTPLGLGMTETELAALAARRVNDSIVASKSLVPAPYASWKHMFRSRPRIRFNGCYISTVNYVRMGQASTSQATWGGSPVHIVTYYRYLRFFRDGSAISLLTTSEPSAVVPHLTRDLLHLHRHRDNTHAYLPSAVMQKAYKGRWRLSSSWEEAQSGPDEAGQPREGDLAVETETHDPKYMFRMDLSLRTAGKGSKNNKVVWRGHFSYNKLTDDWAEFTLKHDKAFFFSRVKSYGMGE